MNRGLFGKKITIQLNKAFFPLVILFFLKKKNISIFVNYCKK